MFDVPGVSRVVTVTVNGRQFGYRRPSRGDEAEHRRMFALKLSMAGFANAATILDQLDGNPLEWECRLAIGLLPPIINGAEAASRGECAPDDWIEVLKTDDKGNVLARRISFENVDPDEFVAVIRAIDEQLTAIADAKKKAQLPPSIGSVVSPPSESVGAHGDSTRT